MDEGLTFTEIITPYLPIIGTVVGGIVIGLFAIWNRRRGALETRAPDVNEIWLQQAADNKSLDIERKLRRKLEDLVYYILGVFKGYVNRVRQGGSTELNTAELELYNAKPSSLVNVEEK